MKVGTTRYSLRLRLRLFLWRVTPVTWLIWALLLADLLAPGYGKLNLIITTVDFSSTLSAISGKTHGANSSNP